MSYLHRDEWLKDAQRVPVGQSRRVYHGAESRPNLVVYNNEDSWSAYCHSCKQSGKVYKQVLQKVSAEPVAHRKYLSTDDLASLLYIQRTQPLVYKRLIGLLHEKGMSAHLLARWQPMYNLIDKRLVFRFQGVDIGRDTSGTSKAKWYVYHNDNPKKYVYLHGETTANGTEPVVLVEDLFSAMKVNYYTGWSVICCLGTRITDEIVAEFVGQDRIPVLLFDGDEAGDVAKATAKSRFGIRGIYFKPLRIADGLDPKDLKGEDLIKLLESLENL